MIGRFLNSADAKREQLDWGTLAWLSSPEVSNAKDLVVIEVTLRPTKGHNFHKHPSQEELIYVIDGQIEQWIDKQRDILKPGDSVFIGADVVHASFNIGSSRDAKLLAILGPCIGAVGYELVDVASEQPWASLR